MFRGFEGYPKTDIKEKVCMYRLTERVRDARHRRHRYCFVKYFIIIGSFIYSRDGMAGHRKTSCGKCRLCLHKIKLRGTSTVSLSHKNRSRSPQQTSSR